MPNRIRLEQQEIESNLREFVLGGSQNQGLQPCERYASFDYCFNYFQDFADSQKTSLIAAPEHNQNSCLQLAFYLASWGMLRGSSALLQKSVKFYEPLIQYIASAPEELWKIDANTYIPKNIQLLLTCKRNICLALHPCGATDTLATKIMLGVFGNVPAFDSFFKYGFGVSTFGKLALERIRDFYLDHADTIDQNRIQTIDFATGKHTQRLYTRAKMIDMIFFIRGS